MRNWLILWGGALVAAALVAVISERAREEVSPVALPVGPASAFGQPATPAVPARGAPARGRAAFLGSEACAECHRAESEAYAGSHHAKALVTPSPEMAATRFKGSRFSSKLGKTTRFALHGAVPVVSTPAATGNIETFPIAYVSGVWPLEQYVVETERGKLQSLGVVWDSRTETDASKRWFHVYGADGIAPGDPLYFTSAAQNWNHVCADCHSTLVERRYEPAADRFDTRWAELSVGCEACHGPGAEHVRTAKTRGPPAPFAVSLKSAEPWLTSETGSPVPRPRDSVEVEVCAPCHSRREPLKEGFLASDPFLDFFEPELLRPASYHADGQVEGEVYEWASFLQSRMYQAGVRCSDCHNVHSGKLHAPGNALCVRCHEPRRFDVEAHSHHVGQARPLCIDCHMPPATFMQIDERRDHSIRIPRPDHSVEFGTPNACNACHTKESASWASARVASWFPGSQKRPHFVQALAHDRKGALAAPRLLSALVDDTAVPAIARATALESLGHYPGHKTLEKLRLGLGSPDSLVVFGAVLGAAQLRLEERVRLLLPAIEHRTRAVRIAAGKALAGVSVAGLSPSERATLERAFLEVEQSFELGASRAESEVERSAFELARGRFSEAEAALRRALELQPCLGEAYLNLAEVKRQRHDEAGSERAIRAALKCNPQHSAAHHALGLWQVRARQTDAAIASLKQAVKLTPTDARFGFVLAVALAGSGQKDQAIEILQASLSRRANDANALGTLARYLHETGQLERAAEARQELELLLQP